jgi:hypothetical protein
MVRVKGTLTSVLAQELLNKLIALDIVASPAVPRPHGLAVSPQPDLFGRPFALVLLFLVNLALQPPPGSLSHLDVARASLVAEVNLEEAAL